MKLRQFLCLAVGAALMCAAVGCGPKAPADMPKTVPFKVKVVDGSKGIAGARVLFLSEQKAVVSAITDSNGVAEITTSLQGYTAKGAPSGEYRVQIVKERLAEHWKTDEERAKMDKPEKDAYLDEWLEKCNEIPREVPAIWEDFDKTPLTASVPAEGGEVTFDVEGKAAE